MAPLHSAGRKNGVGVPRAERALTQALDGFAPRLLPPGSGRSLIHLREVELGTGRPDSILVTVSPSGLDARRNKDLRLPSLAHARVLDSIRRGEPSRYSTGHTAQLTRSLRSIGWLTRCHSVRVVPSLVARSLTIEAKISDWRTGIGQLSKARWASHEAALLMPNETQHRVSRTMLRHSHLGLLAAYHSELTWLVQPPTTTLAWPADLWLTELIIRAMERGPD